MSLIESSNLRDCSYIRRINGLIRLKQRKKINLCRESEFIKNVTQGFRKKLQNCEETNRVRQLWIDELSVQQERGPTTVSELLSQILLEHLTFLLNLLLFRVQDVYIAAILDCRLIHGILLVRQETFFEGLTCSRRQHSAILENSRNLASSSRRLRPEPTGDTMTPGKSQNIP